MRSISASVGEQWRQRFCQRCGVGLRLALLIREVCRTASGSGPSATVRSDLAQWRGDPGGAIFHLVRLNFLSAIIPKLNTRNTLIALANSMHHLLKREIMITNHLKNTLLASLLGLTIPVYAASFDCTRAKSKVEKSICSDPELSSQDEILALAYKEALKTHPVPAYVKARQREWVRLNQYCDTSRFAECLKNNYRSRISHLLATPKLIVYANTKDFSYTEGDMVVEYWPSNEKYNFSVWGGARIHRVASEDNGRPTYTECSFDGISENISGGLAIDPVYDAKLFYRIIGDTIVFPGKPDICPGFAGIPSDPLMRQR